MLELSAMMFRFLRICKKRKRARSLEQLLLKSEIVMDEVSNTARKTLLEYLPAIYQEAIPPERRPFLSRFLAAFERVLLGYEEVSRDSGKTAGASGEHVRDTVEGLGRKIAGLYMLFDPQETPENFLPWLASWAALSIHADLSPAKRRKLIANIIPLYQIRGTRAYLEQLLELCVDAGTSVSEEEIPLLQVGVHSTLGRDTYLGGGPPHYFQVTLAASDLSAIEVQTQRQIAFEVVELAKPAHTGYEFKVDSSQMQVGLHSTVGVDTVLGAAAQLA
jgi:phage tail-like protein